jgi:hypothetical protein
MAKPKPRKKSMAGRFVAVIALIAFALVGAMSALTSTNPLVLLGIFIGGPVVRGLQQATAQVVASQQPELPPFSESFIEDAGIQCAFDFEAPVNDPTSLPQVGASRVGRGVRGIAEISGMLRAMGAPASDDEKTRAAYMHTLMGGLHMFEGRFEDAKKEYEAARATFPSKPETFGQNIEAMLGVASMRRGETENCIACANGSSCIFPLSSSAVHLKPAGSRSAVGHFTKYLQNRPEDLGIRWLLNVAYMTLGEYPAKVPPQYLIPPDRFRSKIDVGKFPNVAGLVGLDVLGDNDAGSCIVDDFNGDGLLDVLNSNVDPERIPAFFINQGDGQFKECGESSGFGGQVGAANATHADIDNDGDLDVLLLRGGWEWAKRPTLLRNQGNGTFEDITAAAGLMTPIASHSGAWADYDNDGFVDLYMVGEFSTKRPDQKNPKGGPDMRNAGRLYHNNRNGTFTDVAASAGVENFLWAKGAAWGDYDNDGDPDLYVSNNGDADRLYRNDGNGKFTDVAKQLGVTGPSLSFSCWWWDYNNDGRLDLFVANFGNTLSEVVRSQLGEPTTGERPKLYRNDGPAGFKDVTTEVGLDRVLVVMGSNFGDIDNDGYLDMYLSTGRPEYRFLVPNVLFKNVDGQRFVDVTTSSGTGHLQKGHGVAFADWDRDGDVDLFLDSGGASPGDRAHNALFLNPGHGNHSVTLRLIGTRTNRAAIGARVKVDIALPGGAKASRYREITSGSSYGGNPFAVTVGLGKAESITAIEVTWPTSGTRQTFHDVALDRSIEITEGQPSFKTLDIKPIRVTPGDEPVVRTTRR